MSAASNEAARLVRAVALLAAAAMLVWPAFVNGYPLLYSDTHAFLVQAGQPRMVWDKPWIYGPFLLALHGNTTLWLPLAAQGLMLAHLLRLLVPGTWRHLALCAVLAAGSAAPWFAALLMPDIFAAVTALGLYLLAFRAGLGAWQVRWLLALTSFAIASHLSHLVIAAACLVVVGLLRWRRLGAACMPLVLALAVLVATNVIGFGRVAVSPNGAIFALARMAGDGIAGPVLERACPEAGWRLCAWAGRLPADSDDFLWSGTGPVWSTPGGPPALAPEALVVVARILREAPLAAMRAAAANTLTQLTRTRLGDTLGADWLRDSVAGSLRAYFPPEEQARFEAAAQLHGGLAGWATPLNPIHAGLLLLGLGGTLAAIRRNPALSLIILAALLANAFATGALSGPHDRYQARLAWLLLLPPLLAFGPTRSGGLPPHRACASKPDRAFPAR